MIKAQGEVSSGEHSWIKTSQLDRIIIILHTRAVHSYSVRETDTHLAQYGQPNEYELLLRHWHRVSKFIMLGGEKSIKSPN